jgi:hypothetical protein
MVNWKFWKKDFESWLNEADTEVKQRKEKDLNREGGLKEDYDNWIHQLYFAYQNNKNSKLLVYVTIILAVITFFYSTLTILYSSQMKDVTCLSSTPFLSITEIRFEKSLYTQVPSLYVLNLTNYGNSPAMIEEIKFSDSKGNIDRFLVKQTIPIGVGKIGLVYQKFPEDISPVINLNVTIKYKGVGKWCNEYFLEGELYSIINEKINPGDTVIFQKLREWTTVV